VERPPCAEGDEARGRSKAEEPTMTMSPRVRNLVVLSSALTMTLTTASVAVATEDDPPPPEQVEDVAWPPPDTDGQWLPVPPGVFTDLTVEACGSTVTMTAGDVDETEYQVMEQAGGTIRVEYRGESTADLTRAHDGAMIDELDTGGPGHEIFTADGSATTYSWNGPSIVFAFDAVEAAVFAEQGLPPLFYYETGNFTERVLSSADPMAETIDSAEVITDTMLGVRDVCDMLDEAAH
jgi:hypothetical protein